MAVRADLGATRPIYVTRDVPAPRSSTMPKPGEVATIPFAVLLEELRFTDESPDDPLIVFPTTFDEHFDECLESPGFALVVEDLMAELARDGTFRLPVVIFEGEICNGNHRVLATYLSGAEHIKVRNLAEDQDGFDVWGNGLYATVTMSLLEGHQQLDPSDPKTIELSFGATSLGDAGVWLEADSGDWLGDELDLYFYNTVEEVEPLVPAIVDRLAALGFTAELKALEIREYGWRWPEYLDVDGE